MRELLSRFSSMAGFTLLPSRLLACSSRAFPHRLHHHAELILRCKMSSSSPLTHSITLPSQPNEPVLVSATSGISSSDFRDAIDSSLFRNWLRNLESETGILADGSMTFKQVLIQVYKDTLVVSMELCDDYD